MADTLAGCGVCYRRQGRSVLNGVDLKLCQGDLVSLLGANGAGKTTLLRLLLGFEAPHGGEVRLNGAAMAGQNRRRIAHAVAYVPQAHAAPFPYRVDEVVALGRLPRSGLFGPPSQHDRALVAATLERLGIAHLAVRPYTALSGGERQLALIARALAQEARLLIMDEPLSGLDYGNQIRLLDQLRRLAADGFGILMTTHHPDHAANCSTRVAVLIDGRIERDGPPAEVVTIDTIHRLYGVRVPQDSLRFRPAP